jgi:hypothetical protein
MRQSVLVLASVVLAACGGSTLREAPRAASLAACAITRNSARTAGELVHTTTGSYPATFTALTSGSPPALVPGNDTSITDTTIEGKGWILTMSGGGTTPPKLTCASAPLG